jgi:hypothetical protein
MVGHRRGRDSRGAVHVRSVHISLYRGEGRGTDRAVEKRREQRTGIETQDIQEGQGIRDDVRRSKEGGRGS